MCTKAKAERILTAEQNNRKVNQHGNVRHTSHRKVERWTNLLKEKGST
jgi:hypothetical protein